MRVFHIEGEFSPAYAGSHSDHREGSYNQENTIIWFAMMQPGRHQSPDSHMNFNIRSIDTRKKTAWTSAPRLRTHLLRSAVSNGRDWTILRSSAISKNVENRRRSISDSYPTCPPTLVHSSWYSGFARELA